MPDPGQRLAQIAALTAIRKAESHPSVGTMLRSRIARRALLKTLDRQPINVTSADVPGPPSRLPRRGTAARGVSGAALGCNRVPRRRRDLVRGQFNIAATADKDTYTDLDVLASSATDELRTLAASTTVKLEHQQQR